jgi:hypothetical protein
MSQEEKDAPGNHTSRMTGHASHLQPLLIDSLRALAAWEGRWPEYETDETLRIPVGQAREVIGELLTRLEENYPSTRLMAARRRRRWSRR